MPVKPRILALWVVAIAALLSYGIISLILSHPLDNRENIGISTPKPDSGPTTGQTMPDAYFFDAKDQKTTLGDFKGNVVLVNLWATWCLPCVAELPSLDKLQGRLHDRNFKVVAISMDRKGGIGLVTDFLEKKGISHLAPYMDSERQILNNWDYGGIPVSFLLDAEGRLVKTYQGPYEWDKGAALEEISALAGGK